MNKGTKSCLGCLGISFGSLLILFLGLYVYSEWFWEEWPPERIERITGVKAPKFAIIERHEGERHFTGDYLDTLIIEFESIPSDELFEEIDRMIASNSTKWEKKDCVYSYFTFWGNGEPAPKGESEAADGIFKITFTKGSKYGEIVDGAWQHLELDIENIQVHEDYASKVGYIQARGFGNNAWKVLFLVKSDSIYSFLIRSLLTKQSSRMGS